MTRMRTFATALIAVAALTLATHQAGVSAADPFGSAGSSGSSDSSTSSQPTTTPPVTTTPSGPDHWVLDQITASVRNGSSQIVPMGFISGTDGSRTIEASVSGTLSTVATIRLDQNPPFIEGRYFIPLEVTLPTDAEEKYEGTVQLSSESAALGNPIRVTITTEFVTADHIPVGISTAPVDRIVTNDNFEVVSDEVLVMVEPGAAAGTTIRQIAASTSSVIFGSSEEIGLYQLRFEGRSSADIDSMVESIAAIPGVVNTAHNFAPAAEFTETDDQYLQEWHTENRANWGLRKIEARDAWNVTTGSSNVTVGVIDQFPVDGEHEDLKSNMRRNGPYYDAPQSHATQTAGIACAVGNNGKGISGVSQICDLRSYTAKYFANLLSEMRSASTQARVVNISLGFGEKTLNTCLGVSSSGRKLDEMKRQLLAVVNFSPNTLWVAAAGNFCADANLSYPGALGALSDRVITVGATTRDDEWAPKSAYGGAVNVVAPGGVQDSGITTTNVDCLFFCVRNYTQASGTSMAAPFVTGTAALGFSGNTSVTPRQMKYCLEQGARSGGKYVTRPGDGSSRKYYIIDAHETLNCVRSGTPNWTSCERKGSGNSRTAILRWETIQAELTGYRVKVIRDTDGWTERTVDLPSPGNGGRSEIDLRISVQGDYTVRVYGLISGQESTNWAGQRLQAASATGTACMGSVASVHF